MTSSFKIYGLVLATVALDLLRMSSAVGLADWDDFVMESFVTEPHIMTYRMSTIERIADTSRLAPGYLFTSPFPRSTRGVENIWIGPHIMDSDGELVWWGNASTSSRTQGLQPCSYLGGDNEHLCWSEATWTDLDHVNGTNHVLDNSYTAVVKPFGQVGSLRFPNPHEMKTTVGGKTLLNCVYDLKRVDLTPYNGAKDGYIEDGCFQEIDVLTREALFEWCGTSSLELWHSYIFLDIPENVVNRTGEQYGKGTIRKPWDYFHINSVEKTPDGNYVVSARHLNQLIKVAGRNNTSGHEPGSLVWRLGGKFNDFAGADLLDLSRQHHVTLVDAVDSLETYSVFNNHWMANQYDRRISNGQVFTLNISSLAVVSARKYYNPEGALSLAQGSTQVLSNDNVLVGWGTVPQFTEFSENGEILWHAHLDKYDETRQLKNMQNYRVVKYPWVGKPRYPPKLIVYAQKCITSSTSPLTAYVSWNGATEVKYWRFFTSTLSSTGPWTAIGTFAKTGFETTANLQNTFAASAPFAKFIRVDALDKHKMIIGQASAITFVPSANMSGHCNGTRCYKPRRFEYDIEWNIVDECQAWTPPHSHARFGILLVLVLIESVLYAMYRLIRS